MILSHDVAGHIIYLILRSLNRDIYRIKKEMGALNISSYFFSKQTSSCIQYKNIVIVRKNNFKSGERHHINAR